MKELFVSFMSLLTATLFLVACLSVTAWVVPPALRTGRLEARGRYYDRRAQPARFWLAIFVWITLSALSILGFYAVVVGTMKTQGWIN
jgi:hypothetical protein